MRITGRRRVEQKSPELTISPQIAGKPYRGWTGASPGTIISDGLGRSVALYVAVTRIASAIAAARLEAVQGEDSEVITSPFAERFNTAPNASEDGLSFSWRLCAQLLLFGEGAFVQIEGLPQRPSALWLLDPRFTKPIPGRDEMVAGYEAKIPGTSSKRILEPAEVVHIRFPHPLDPFVSLTPLSAAGLSVDLDYHAALYANRFLDADGMPAALLTTPQELNDDAIDEILADLAGDQLSAGYERAGRVHLLAGIEDLSLRELAASPKVAQYAEGRKLAQAETMLAYGTPRSVAGDASERTFANADAEEATWYRWVVQPIAGLIASAFDRLIYPDVNTSLRFSFAGSALLRREEVEARTQNREDLLAGAILIDEYRAAIGREPLPNGEGQVTITRGPTVLDAGPVETKDAEELIAFGHFRITPTTLAARRSAAERAKIAAEDMIARRLGASLARQRAVVLEKLQGSKQFRARFAEMRRAGEILAKAYDPNRMFDLGTWNKRLEDDLTEVLQLAIGDGGEPVARVFDISFNRADPRIGAGIEARIAQIINPETGEGFNETTLAALRSSLAEGAFAGEDLAQLVERVEAIYDDVEGYRAERIARTEALGGTNLGRFEAARQAGIGGVKTWLAVGDHRTREWHAEADGQEVGLDDPFEVGGEAIMYPGEDGASGYNVINCRCEALIEGPEGELI